MRVRRAGFSKTLKVTLKPSPVFSFHQDCTEVMPEGIDGLSTAGQGPSGLGIQSRRKPAGTSKAGAPPVGSPAPGKGKGSTKGDGNMGSPGGKFTQSRSMVERIEKSKELLEAIAVRETVKSRVSEIVGAQFKLKHSFGSSSTIPDPVISYAGPPTANSDHDYSDRIVYNVGAQMVIHDVGDNTKFFLKDRPSNVAGITHISLDSTKSFVSVCEMVTSLGDDDAPQKSQLSVYGMKNKDHECLATFVHPNPAGFSRSVFANSHKSRHIVALTGASNPEIVIWNWETKKVIKHVTLPSPVTTLRCGPSQDLMITTSNDQGLRAWYSAGETLGSVNLIQSLKDQEGVVDHCWMPSGNGLNKMVALGRVLEPGEGKRNGFRRQILTILEGVDHVASSGTMDQKTKIQGTPIILEQRQSIVLKLLKAHTNDSELTAVCRSQKGFVVVGNYGHISFYERTDDKREPYIEVRFLSLGELFPLRGACMLPSESDVVVITDLGRLVRLPVEMSIESDKEAQKISSDESMSLSERLVGYGAADVTHGGVHTNAITCASMAQDRSIVVTICVGDNSLRIWNYETMKCECVHEFGSDEPLSVAVHPNGLFLVVSFKDRVRGYNIAMANLKPYKEVIQKGCKEIAFSDGGQYFACASGINLVVFNTQSFDKLSTFQGHMMPIKRICWVPGDLVVFSAGVDGTVYGWPISRDGRIDVLASNPRASSILSIEVDSNSLAFLPPLVEGSDDGAPATRVEEARSVCVASMDGRIKLPPWSYTEHHPGFSPEEMDRTIWGEGEEAITCMKLSSARRLMYAGTKAGTVRCYAWPPVNDNKVGIYTELHVHSGPVMSIFESPRGDALITAGDDGSVFCLSLTKSAFTKKAWTEGSGEEKEESNAKTMDFEELDEEPFPYNDTILLLGADEMEDHVEEVARLHKSMKELQTASDYKISTVESAAAEERNQMSYQFETTLNEEKDRYEQLRNEFDEKVKSLLQTIESKEAESLKVVSDLENRYEHKLADQLDRYDNLTEEMELLRQKCEGLLLADRNDFTKQLNDTINNARLREKKMRTENKRITDDRSSDESAFKEILNQQEHEYEDELRQLIGAAEGELTIERENIAKLRTLVQTKNTKLDQLKKKLIELSMASKARATLLNNEKQEKVKLMETIEHYKKNLLEREEVVAEKEKIIMELRSKTRTLENFRFVLDHRLQQLSAERGPIAHHIEGLERHISTMYEELVEEFENKKSAEIEKEKLDQRNATVVEDLNYWRTSSRKTERYIGGFKRELGNIISANVVGKELEESVRLLYRKYVKGEAIRETTVKASGEALDTAKKLTRLNDADDISVMSGASQYGDGGGGGGKVGGKNTNTKGFVLEVEETLIESAKEAERQKISKGKEAQQLKHRLDATRQESLVQSRKRLGENSNLLFEVNDLRKDVRKAEKRIFDRDETIKELQHSLRELKRKSKDLSASTNNTASKFPVANSTKRVQTPTISESFHAPPSQERPPGTAGMDARIISNTGEEVAHSAAQAGAEVAAQMISEKAPGFAVEISLSNNSEKASAMLKSRSESALRSAKPVGMVDVRAGPKPNGTWVVHNSLAHHTGGMMKAQSEAVMPQNYSVDPQEEMTSIHGEAWSPPVADKQAAANAQSHYQSEQEFESVHDGPNAPPLPSKKLNASQGKGSTIQGKERVIEKLQNSNGVLSNQLDEAYRIKENQRVEIQQLRKQLAKQNGKGFNSFIGSTTSGRSGVITNTQQFRMTNDNDTAGIQMSDEYGGADAGENIMWDHGGEMNLQGQGRGDITLGGNIIQTASNLTNADRTGKPSQKDLDDMKLASVGLATQAKYPNRQALAKGRKSGSKGAEKVESGQAVVALPSITPAALDGASLDEGSMSIQE